MIELSIDWYPNEKTWPKFDQTNNKTNWSTTKDYFSFILEKLLEKTKNNQMIVPWIIDTTFSNDS